MFQLRLIPALTIVRIGGAVLALSAIGAQSAAAATDPPPCNKATAEELVEPIVSDLQTSGVQAVYCGEFLGPGSQAMVVEIAPNCGCTPIPPKCGCQPTQAWQAFGVVDGAWRPSAEGPHLEGAVLAVKGASIAEVDWLHRKADWFHYSPTGGIRSRAWSWDGTQLVVGPWKQTQAAEPKGEVAHLLRTHFPIGFYVAGKPIACYLEDDREAHASCEFQRPPISTVSMNPRGHLTICRAPAHAYGCHVGSGGQISDTLHTGQSIVVGRFHCWSERSGMRCIVAGSGTGFLINRTGVHRVSGAPSPAPAPTRPRTGPVRFFSNVVQSIPASGPDYYLAIRPSMIGLTGDGSWILRKLRWTGWGSRVARGKGISSASDGIPSNAEGKRVETSATITLSHLGRFRGDRVYRCFRLTVPPPATSLHGCLKKQDGPYYIFE